MSIDVEVVGNGAPQENPPGTLLVPADRREISAFNAEETAQLINARNANAALSTNEHPAAVAYWQVGQNFPPEELQTDRAVMIKALAPIMAAAKEALYMPKEDIGVITQLYAIRALRHYIRELEEPGDDFH